MTAAIPRRNRAQYFRRVIELLLASAEVARPELTLTVFDNHSSNDTEQLCGDCIKWRPRLSCQCHPEEASSADQSASLALRASAGARGSEFFLIFGHDDMAFLEACPDVMRALQDSHDFFLTDLEAGLTTLPRGVAARVAYYDTSSRYAHCVCTRDLFQDFGLFTATTILSGSARRPSCLDLAMCSQLLAVLTLYRHRLGLLITYDGGRAAALSGVQIRYAANFLGEGLRRLRASELLANGGAYWPYCEGIWSLLELAGARLSGHGGWWQNVEKAELSKHAWCLVHGILRGLLFSICATQALLGVDIQDPTECLSAHAVQRFRRFVQTHASGRQRDVGLALCEVIDDLPAASPADGQGVATTRRIVQVLGKLGVASRLVCRSAGALVLTRGHFRFQPLRAAPFGAPFGELA